MTEPESTYGAPVGKDRVTGVVLTPVQRARAQSRAQRELAQRHHEEYRELYRKWCMTIAERGE